MSLFFFTIALGDSLGFYIELLRSEGVKSVDMSSIEIADKNSLLKEESFLIEETSKIDGDLFSKLLSIENENTRKKLILICNSNFIQENLFSCDSKAFTIIDEASLFRKEVLRYPAENIEVTINILNYKSFDIFIINENSFQGYTENRMITSYFKAISKSSSIPSASLSIKDYLEILYTDLKESVVFEISAYLLLSLFITLFFLQFKEYFQSSSKHLRVGMLKESLYSLFFGVYRVDALTRTIFILALTSYSLLAMVYIYKNGINQFLSLISVGTLLKLNDFYKKSELENFSMASITILMLVFLLLSKVELLEVFFKSLFSIVQKKEIKKSIFKYIYLLSNLFLIIFFMFYIKFGWVELLYFFIILNLIINLIVWKKSYKVSEILNTKDKFVFLFFCVLVLLFYFFFDANEIVNPKKSYENLLKVSDKIITFPYYKDMAENSRISNFSYKLNTPIFVNNYLIHFPQAKEIINTGNFDSFNSNQNFILSSYKKDDFLKHILRVDNLTLKSFSTNPTNYLYTFHNNKSETKPHLKIILTCENLKSLEFKVRRYRVIDNKSKIDDFNIGNILSCDRDRKVYNFDLPKDFFEGNAIYEMLFSKSINLKSIELYEGSNEIKFNYISFQEHRIDANTTLYYLNSVKENANQIYNYSLELMSNYTVNSSVEDTIDITLNNLLDKGFIDSQFIIWTLEPYKIFINRFSDY